MTNGSFTCHLPLAKDLPQTVFIRAGFIRTLLN